MKVVILAGGYGTRISEETEQKPKPMIEIGGKPIIWHIMKLYSYYGLKEFIICCGYKGHLIKEFFLNYSSYLSDFTIDLSSNSVQTHISFAEDWKITLVDTGQNTMTGGRIARVKKYLKNEENFCMTYGDGVSNVNINKLIKFHISQNKIATLTAVKPEGRFGSIEISKNLITNFKEKKIENSSYVNGGFFILNKKIFKYLKSDQTIFEEEPVKTLARQNNLVAFKHNGFWQPMDTIRDKNLLESLWISGAPWRIWE